MAAITATSCRAPETRTTAETADGPRSAAVGARADTVRVVRRLGRDGGTLKLGDIAVARFEAGVLSRPADVTLAATHTAETARDWESTAPVDPRGRAASELRITLGEAAPAGPVKLELRVPAGLQAERVALFAQVYQRNAQELLDGFVRIESVTTGETVRFSLGPEAFTGERRADGRQEAVVILAAVR